jgi:hypothetical protein
VNNHPDAALKVGATREAAGLTWVLYKNQYGLAWKAGPRARNIRIAVHVSEVIPYYVGGVGYATFEKAAAKALTAMAADYAKAKALVVAYEAAG